MTHLHKEPYGRVPFSMVDSGVIAEMTEADSKVMLAIAGHFQDGIAYPGKSRLARLCGLHRRTVERATKRLEKLGILEVSRGGGRGNRTNYRLVWKSNCVTAKDDHPCQSASLIGQSQTPTEQSQFKNEKAAVPYQKRGSRRRNQRPRDRVEHKGNTNSNITNTPLSPAEEILPFKDLIQKHPALSCPEFEKAWQEWNQYRKESRRKLTQSTAGKQIELLAKAGPQMAVRMIEQSVTSGWVGLFSIKEDSSRAAKSSFTPARSATTYNDLA